MKPSIGALQRTLDYQFRDLDLLDEALTHSSYGRPNNERLEYLGDSVLGLIVSEELFERFGAAREGKLTRLRARLVRGVTLSEIARELGLGDHLNLGSGELRSGGSQRNSILADALEALIGAIYLDAGMEICRATVLRWYQDRLQRISLDDVQKDPKTRLQEYLQGHAAPLPSYRVRQVTGKAHAQTFHVECRLAKPDIDATGVGASRRAAEQAAAAQALGKLGVDV